MKPVDGEIGVNRTFFAAKRTPQAFWGTSWLSYLETTDCIASLCRVSKAISGCWSFLELEIRPEFDNHTSNEGMLQSGTSHLDRFPEFHQLLTRRRRVLLRQLGGPKRKTPGLMRTSLLRLIFSPVAFEFSS